MALNLDDKSEEEILALLADPSKLEALAAAGEEATPEPTPAETAPPPEPPPAEPPKDETPPTEPEPTVEDIDKQLLLERLKHAEEEAKRFEGVAGRHAGELGYLKDKIRQLESRPVDRGLSDDIPPEPIPEPARSQGRDPLLAYVTAQAIPQAVAAFEARHPDAGSLAAGMGEYLRDRGVNILALAEGNDPRQIHEEVERHLASAYDHAKSVQRAEAIKALETKRAEMFTRLKETKTAASPPAPASPAPPAEKPKVFADLSQAEMLVELQRLARG